MGSVLLFYLAQAQAQLSQTQDAAAPLLVRQLAQDSLNEGSVLLFYLAQAQAQLSQTQDAAAPLLVRQLAQDSLNEEDFL